MLFARGRKIAHKYLAPSSDRAPALVVEFLQMLLGSLLAFWIIAKLLGYIPHAGTLVTLPLFGLLLSIQATYYRYRLAVDPSYKIPKCGCRAHGNDSTEVVLRSGRGTVVGIPNSLLGVAFYPTLVLMVYLNHGAIAIWLAAAGVVASAFLSYMMVARIQALCALCINTAALNLLIFLKVWIT